MGGESPGSDWGNIFHQAEISKRAQPFLTYFRILKDELRTRLIHEETNELHAYFTKSKSMAVFRRTNRLNCINTVTHKPVGNIELFGHMTDESKHQQ